MIADNHNTIPLPPPVFEGWVQRHQIVQFSKSVGQPTTSTSFPHFTFNERDSPFPHATTHVPSTLGVPSVQTQTVSSIRPSARAYRPAVWADVLTLPDPELIPHPGAIHPIAIQLPTPPPTKCNCKGRVCSPTSSRGVPRRVARDVLQAAFHEYSFSYESEIHMLKQKCKQLEMEKECYKQCYYQSRCEQQATGNSLIAMRRKVAEYTQVGKRKYDDMDRTDEDLSMLPSPPRSSSSSPPATKRPILAIDTNFYPLPHMHKDMVRSTTSPERPRKRLRRSLSPSTEYELVKASAGVVRSVSKQPFPNAGYRDQLPPFPPPPLPEPSSLTEGDLAVIKAEP